MRKAAKLAGVNRTAVYKILHTYGIPTPRAGVTGHRGNWGDLSHEEPRGSPWKGMRLPPRP